MYFNSFKRLWLVNQGVSLARVSRKFLQIPVLSVHGEILLQTFWQYFITCDSSSSQQVQKDVSCRDGTKL